MVPKGSCSYRTIHPRGQFMGEPSHPMTTVQYCQWYNIVNKEVGMAMIPKLSVHMVVCTVTTYANEH